MSRPFKLDLTRGFDPMKPIPPPIRPMFSPPPTSFDRDALQDYDEVGSKVGVPVTLDWDYLLARVDFTKRKWWLIERDVDESGEERQRVSEAVEDVLGDFIDFSDDPATAFQQRIWLKRLFRYRDEDTYRLGKDPRFKDRELLPPDVPEPPPPAPPDSDQPALF